MSSPLQWSARAQPDQSNEDALFVRDRVAVVVDGAGLPRSMRAGCRHSVDWYANRLAAAFGTALLDQESTMSEALSRSIKQVSHHHDGCTLDDGSPSATVAAWRLRPPVVEYLVLCDASVVVLTGDGAVEITDDRLTLLTTQRLDQAAAGTRRACSDDRPGAVRTTAPPARPAAVHGEPRPPRDGSPTSRHRLSGSTSSQGRDRASSRSGSRP